MPRLGRTAHSLAPGCGEGDGGAVLGAPVPQGSLWPLLSASNSGRRGPRDEGLEEQEVVGCLCPRKELPVGPGQGQGQVIG